MARLTPAGDAEAYAAILQAARRILLTKRHIIGLVPAAAHVAVPPVAVQLALALGTLLAMPIGFVDANTTWPAFSALAPYARPGGPPQVLTVEIDEGAHGGKMTLTTPAPSTMPFERSILEETLAWHRERHARVLVDLTGLDLAGDHLEAFSLVDGVVIVVQTGVTSEQELLATQRQIPPERNLGALLLG